MAISNYKEGKWWLKFAPLNIAQTAWVKETYCNLMRHYKITLD
jgi:hypothetical protein